MLNKNAVLFAGILAALTGVAVYFSLDDAPVPAVVPEPVAVVAAAPFVGPRSKEQAMEALAALPELKAWSEHLETSSGGTVRGALIIYGPTPKLVDGKRYWQFSYVENTPEAAHRWESFLVGENTEEILVDDLETDQPITLEQWRAERHPMRRTSAL